MTIWKYPLIMLMCLLLTGCAALLSEQEYVLIDQLVSKKYVYSGLVFSIPERANVRKIMLIGTGKIQNFEIFVSDAKNRWEPFKKIHGAIEFPFEIPLIANTNAIKIVQRTIVGRGNINTVQFYSVAEKIVNNTPK